MSDMIFKRMIREGKLTWLPWIGKKYGKDKVRLLIVGESHYCDEKDKKKFLAREREIVEDVNFTRSVVDESAVRCDWPHNMFEGLHRVLFKMSLCSAESRKKFWDSICFYNFIQRPMEYTERLKERPSREDFLDAWKSLVALAKIIKPTHVIFVGVSAMAYFDSGLSVLGVRHQMSPLDSISCVCPRRGWFSVDRGRCEVIAIRHTSSHFPWRAWHQCLAETFPRIIEHLNNIVFVDYALQQRLMTSVCGYVKNKCDLVPGGFVNPEEINENTGYVFLLKGTNVKIRLSAASRKCGDIFVGIRKNEAKGHWKNVCVLCKPTKWEKDVWRVWKYCQVAKSWDTGFYAKCQTDSGFCEKVEDEIAQLILELADAVKS